jgi:hypothetical protein
MEIICEVCKFGIAWMKCFERVKFEKKTVEILLKN